MLKLKLIQVIVEIDSFVTLQAPPDMFKDAVKVGPKSFTAVLSVRAN